ncbi:MAG: Chromosomal replication initiator protein DnaA, partial [Candidatus Hydrogenedentes bacterium]|nr:Chromosomal replication initiator protein DnaA [Candidatus Hydrogenedentota bacterium]
APPEPAPVAHVETPSEPEPELVPLLEPLEPVPAAPIQTTAPAPAVSSAELAQAIRDAVQEAVTAAAPAGNAGQEMATALRETMQEIVAEMARFRRDAQDGPAPPPAITADDLAQVMRNTMQETVAAMAVQMRAVTGEVARPTGPSGQEILEGMREAVREALAAGQQTAAQHGASEASEARQALASEAAHIAETARQVVEAMQRSIQESQSAQEFRLSQLTDAALETTRAAQTAMHATQSAIQASQTQQQSQVEATAVAEANMRDLKEAEERREQERRKVEDRKWRERHASVRPFRPEAGAVQGELGEDDRRVFDALGSEKPLEGLTFDSFFAGKTNAFSYKLGQAVAAEPGGDYNPFFLYGSVGVGKTHLINAIGHAACAKVPGTRVGYVSASTFARRLAEALQEQALDLFRESYCYWDILILDDIQFLGGRIEAQEEFFHIFNVLHNERRQIIIAGDKAPDKLGLLEQRLISRFSGGIVAELKAPDMETRMAILRHHVAQSNTAVPEEILSMVAMRVSKDIRMMVGALRKILAFANLVGEEISYDMANEILGHLGIVEAA